jgi:hypothetical protein
MLVFASIADLFLSPRDSGPETEEGSAPLGRSRPRSRYETTFH